MLLHRWRKPAQRDRKEPGSGAHSPRSRPGVEALESRNLLATLVGITGSGQVVDFDSDNPDVVTSSVPLTGILPGEFILASDVRPATGQLYMIGSSHRLYTMSPGGSQASVVGGFLVPITGNGVGMDFNPLTDQIRVVTDLGENLRLNPNSGAVIDFDPFVPGTQADLDLPPGFRVVAIAYSNNTANAGAVTLYGIDSGSNSLVRIGGANGVPSPNIGTVTTIGSMGINTTDLSSFDIADDGTAYATLVLPDGAGTQLFRISLTTGRATSISAVGTGESITAMAVSDSTPSVSGRIQFSQSAYTVNEGTGLASIAISRVGGNLGPATVTFSTVGGTATPGVDYVPVTQTVTFGNGESRATATINILTDGVAEGSETVLLQLSNPVGGTPLGTPSNATLTILDQSQGGQSQFQFQTANFTAVEGSPASIVITRTGTTTQAGSVQLSTANGTATAGVDYVSLSQLVNFTAGQTVATATIATLTDTLTEGAETVRLTLTNPTTGDSLGNPSTATLTIQDGSQGNGQSVFRFSQASYTANEGTTATITISRTGDTQNPGSVMFQTVGGTATPGADYVTTVQTVQFNVGETIKTVAISVLADSTSEGAETVTMTLTNPGTGDTIGTPGTATLTITDGSQGTGQSIFRFTQAAYSADEGTTATISISRTGDTQNPASVMFQTVGGTATAGADYIATTETVQFNVGETAKTVSITVLPDSTVEGSETVTMTLSGPSNSDTIGTPGTATLTIRDTDQGGGGGQSQFRFTQTAYVADEGTTALVSVSRTGATTQSASVTFTTGGGSAQPGVDYVPVTQIVTFGAGETLKTVSIAIAPDATAEVDESVGLQLSSPSAGSSLVTPSTSTLTIRDAGGVTPLNPTQAYIQQVYHDLLRRDVDPEGLAYWTHYLTSGGTRFGFGLTIANSVEYRVIYIRDLFQRLIGRQPDSVVVGGYLQLLAIGGTFDQIEARILGASEYAARKGGGSNLGYLQAIYADVLGRGVSEFDKVVWRPLFAANLTHQQIALTLMSTREADQVRVSQLFRDLLHREPDIAGVTAFTDAMQRGARDEAVIASIVASDEYYNRATQNNLLNAGF